MPLTEPERLAYLNALGIDSYFPRMQLPGAPASVIVEINNTEAVPEETDMQAPAPARQPGPANKAPSANKTPPANKQPPPARARPTPASAAKTGATASPDPASSRARTPAGEDVRLQLLCIRAGTDLAILNAMPHMGPGILSPGHRALLANLLAACGIATSGIEIEDKPFRWPMVTGLHVDNSRSAAAVALTAYLRQKRTDWGFSKLLVLGEEVVQRLYAGDDDGENAAPSPGSDDWRVVHTRSLDEMLQRPVLKKEAWTRIRTLLA